MSTLTLILALVSPLALAGGSHYGTPAGTPASFSGRVSEWPVPTPAFARDPAVAPDGSIFIAVMAGNKVARFDPASQSFKEWELPRGHHPHGLLVDRTGIVWTTGNGNGTIGRLDPATGKMRELPTPTRDGGPHTLVISDDGSTIWFTLQSGNRIGRLDTASGKITEYPTSAGPYGITLDRQGRVWFCRMGDDRLGILDPASGKMSELALPEGSRRGAWPPRRTAASGSPCTATTSSCRSIPPPAVWCAKWTCPPVRGAAPTRSPWMAPASSGPTKSAAIPWCASTPRAISCA